MTYIEQLQTEHRARRQRLYGNIGKPIVRHVPIPALPPAPKWGTLDSVLTLTPLKSARPTIPTILDLVALAHGIKVSELLSKRRTADFVLARAHAIATLCERRPDLSTPSIGRRLGLDHSTIVHHRKKWPQTRQRCPQEVATVYEQMERFCNHPDAEPMVG
jgi:hypothetical protein